MIKITSTRAIEWPSLSIRKGENVFLSSKAIPADLFPRLERFADLGILTMEGDGATKLEQLSQVQLYSLGKADLAELAKASGVSVPEGASKAQLLGELEKRLAPGAIAGTKTVEPAPVTIRGVDGESVVVTSRRKREG